MTTTRWIWILAAVAALLVALVGAALVLVVLRTSPDTEASKERPTVTVDAPVPQSTVTVTAAQPAPQAQPEPIGPTTGEPSSDGDAIATDRISGEDIVCALNVKNGVWVNSAPIADEVHTIGEPCDPAVDVAARDSAGRAIMCGGQTWVRGP
ncbi:hypothetical protein [Williamsia sterculiae]|uniref:Uncharacterized protein n=1 Tax=Williamsia sterculiae TaxID=1344003 RepID=A0A1N7GKG5_9NOCA|nr:hypothetical protein [Williamsia sterculiae]SIS13101.1 hypothetical protein SAMN05445060_2911 [Williamsia sterculiae]